MSSLDQAAAKQDDADALLFLGTANMDGRLVAKDQKKGLAFLRKAATLGSADAQLKLGRRYQDGNEVDVDIRVAEKYLQSEKALCVVRVCGRGPLTICSQLTNGSHF